MQNDNWRIKGRRRIHETPWLALDEFSVVSPLGTPATYTITVTEPFVMVAAIEDGKLLMIRQHRFTTMAPTLEFPGGGIDESESPLEAAKRELAEETGYTATRWRRLGDLNEAIGIARHTFTLFVATDLRKDKATVRQPDPDGILLDSPFVPITELEQKIRDGQVCDTKTIAILFRLQQDMS